MQELRDFLETVSNSHFTWRNWSLAALAVAACVAPTWVVVIALLALAYFI